VAKFLAQQATSQQATYCLLNNEKGSHIYIYKRKSQATPRIFHQFITINKAGYPLKVVTLNLVGDSGSPMRGPGVY
jgi:hypothetical protein